MLYRLTMHLRWRVLIVAVAAVAAATALVGQASAANHSHRHRTHHRHRGVRHVRSNDAGNTGSATGLGQLSGLLPASHLTLESAIQVNLSNETVRLPIYPGDRARARVIQVRPSGCGTSWRTPRIRAPPTTSASTTRRSWRTSGSAAQRACRRSPRTTLRLRPIPFGPAVIHFAGAPDFSPTRIAVPGPTGFPLQVVPARGGGRSGIQPVHPDRRLGRPSTTRRSSPPAMVRTTSSTTPTPATGSWGSTSEARRRPASSRSRGPTCCSSRALTPESRSST